MREEFPGSNLDSNALYFGWGNHIRLALRENFRAVHKLDAETAAVLARGSQGAAHPGPVDPRGARPHVSQHMHRSFQEIHALSHGGPRPGPGASYEAPPTIHSGSHRGPQPGYGDEYVAPQPGSYRPTYREPQSGHQRQYGSAQLGSSASFGGSHSGYDGQYGAPRPGVGNPYQNTPGTNRLPPPVASPYPPSVNYQLPPIMSVGQVPTNQGPPPLEPNPMSIQNYGNPVPQATAPGTQEPLIWYRTGRGGSNSRHPRGGHVSEENALDQQYRFSPEEEKWIVDEGIFMGHGHREAQEFYDKFKGEFGNRTVPSKKRVLDEFKYLRTTHDSRRVDNGQGRA